MNEKLIEGLAEMLATRGKAAKMLKFDTEDQCIEHCVKLARLQPGDIVFIDGEQKAVFFAWDVNNGKAFCVFHDSNDGECTAIGSPIGCLTFEPVTDK
jgi:hypothetical protein